MKKQSNLIRSLALGAGTLLTAPWGVQGGLIFVGIDASFRLTPKLSPFTGEGEVSGTPAFDRKVTPNQTELKMNGKLSVEADTYTDDDLAEVGVHTDTVFVRPIVRPPATGITPMGGVFTDYDGTGLNWARLHWSMTVEGTYKGVGGYAESGVEVLGLINDSGSIVREQFKEGWAWSSDGPIDDQWEFLTRTGKKLVTSGLDVTPMFDIPDFGLVAKSSGYASMENTWTYAKLVMWFEPASVTEPPEPETWTLAAVGLVLVGCSRLRRRPKQAAQTGIRSPYLPAPRSTVRGQNQRQDRVILGK